MPETRWNDGSAPTSSGTKMKTSCIRDEIPGSFVRSNLSRVYRHIYTCLSFRFDTIKGTQAPLIDSAFDVPMDTY